MVDKHGLVAPPSDSKVVTIDIVNLVEQKTLVYKGGLYSHLIYGVIKKTGAQFNHLRVSTPLRICGRIEVMKVGARDHPTSMMTEPNRKAIMYSYRRHRPQILQW